MFNNIIIQCVLVCVYILAGESLAHAYIDPGTGSYLIQIIIGGIVTVGMFFRRSLSSIGAFMLKVFRFSKREKK